MDQLDPLPPAETPRRPRAWLLVVLLLLVGAGAAVWFVVGQPRGPAEPPPFVDLAARPVDAGPTLSIDEGDALLRRLAAGWSADPLYAKWLEALVLRQLVAATQLVAEGDSPRTVLPFLALQGPFVVREEAAPKARKASKRKSPEPAPRVFIAPESYARYDAVAAAFGSVDSAAAGAAWSRLLPFCDAAFAEIGRPGQRFDDVLAAALRRLVSVQLVEGEVELVPVGAVYAFKDPSLEALSPAEKHLLRMGPQNARVIQAQLRSFAAAAGLDLRQRP